MALVTRNLKPTNSYQQWAAADLTVGDVLGIYESLGNRSARSITIESLGGISIVRFNVIKKLFKNQESVGNSYMSEAAAIKSAVLVGEVIEEQPNITMEAGGIYMWKNEIAVNDIQIIVKSSGLRITVS